MPTQEERLNTLEKKTTAAIQEIDENTTIMLGVIRHQGQDIRRILQRLETVEEYLDTVKTKLDEHTTLLNQILARLSENHN